MPDIYLFAGEANPNDIRLRDPTILVGGSVDGTAIPSVLASVFAIMSGAFAGGAVASPSVLDATFASQSPTASGDATATVAEANLTWEILSPSVAGSANASPSLLLGSFTLQVATAAGTETGSVQLTGKQKRRVALRRNESIEELVFAGVLA